MVWHVCAEQAVNMLHEEVGSQPEGTCGDMLVLPIYAALPPELQVCPLCCSSPPSLHCIMTCPFALCQHASIACCLVNTADLA